MGARYIVGDARKVLATLPDDSVDLIFSSPPFLALRSYLPADHESKHLEIGSESTPGEFLDVLLDVVEECGRVLAPHGTLCFELGDTYAGSGGAGGDYNNAGMREGQPKFDGSSARNRGLERAAEYDGGASDHHDFAKPGTRSRLASGDGWPEVKSLCLIPQLFAFALAYGFNPLTGRQTPRWKVRNLVAWCRPNPPVGALGDKFRPATSFLTVACKGRRWFDLDAVREPAKIQMGRNVPGNNVKGSDDKSHRYAERVDSNPAGVPPLDYWVIPTEPSTEAGTYRQVRVQVDARGGDIQRTTSPDCPVHGSPDRPGSNAECGGRGADASIRTEHTGSHREPEPLPGFAPTPTTPDPTASTRSLDGPAAIAHSTASSRTGRVPATTTPDTASVGSPARTDDTSTSPASSAPDANTSGSNIEPAYRLAIVPGTADHIAHTSDQLSACTCTWFIDAMIAEPTSHYAPKPDPKQGEQDRSDPHMLNRGGHMGTHPLGPPPLDYWVIPTEPYAQSHYATFPRALCVKPVKAMCPARVCRVCGKPSERITEPTANYAAQMGDQLRSDNDNGASRSKTRNKLQPAGMVAAEYVTLGWSDCGCSTDDSHWRAGVVLDPFAGSGTALQVATGHGRDAIGIDLDPSNVELARGRVGPMFFELEEM